jgi:Acetoacetate decarboxylase (ADC)
MSESYLPPYTDRPGEQVLEPPYVAHGVRLHLCFVAAAVDRLNALIDNSLNRALQARAPGAPRFGATGQRIIFMFAEIDRMYSAGTDYVVAAKAQTRQGVAGAGALDAARKTLEGHEFVRETELGIWVPISRLIYGQQSPGFYLPFVFNGTPASVVTGREVYGYPKQLASFDQHDPRPGALGAVEMSTWHRRPGEAEYQPSPLLTITLATDHRSDPDGPWQTAVEGVLQKTGAPGTPRVRFRKPGSEDDTTQAQPDGSAAWEQFVRSMVQSAPLCFLRQFRDPVSPPDATLQQIIAARFVIQSSPKFWVYGEGGGIAFEPSDTLDLIEILGLEHADRTVPIHDTVVIDELDFTVDLGKVLG